MNVVKMLLLIGAGLLWVPTAYAQKDDKYLDDAYYRRSDIEKLDQEARRKAELRAAAARAEREAWQKEQEVTMMDMGMSSEYDSYLMESTPLEELLDHKGQHLFFVFDMLSERGFFIELVEMIPGKSLDKPIITHAEGKAPQQLASIDVAASRSVAPASGEVWDEDGLEEDSIDEGEIDLEGFDIADAESLY